MTKNETPEEKKARIRFEKLVKMFTSAIFDQKHGFIYLDRSQPYRMLCATYSPDELYSRSRVVMDAVHRVVTKEIDLFPLWETLLPIKEFDRLCISFSGIRAMKTKCGTDHEKMKELWLEDPNNGMLYIEKISKQGRREKIEQRPIIWPLSESYFRDLEDELKNVIEWVEDCPKTNRMSVTRDELTRSEINLLSLKELGLGEGVRLPYCNGLDGTSLFGYSTLSKLEKVTIHIGQDGNVLRYYCTSNDEFASVTSALPNGIRYPR